MYQFKVSAHTTVGETIWLTGSNAELGEWDGDRMVELTTNSDSYPQWISETIETGSAYNQADTIEYKYVKLDKSGNRIWESQAGNRWLPVHPKGSAPIVVEDGWFGKIQPFPFGYYQTIDTNEPKLLPGRRIVVMGSSVASGFSGWLCHGWAYHLANALENRGDNLINASELGTNVTATLKKMPQAIELYKPDCIIISLSLGNEGLAECAPYERKAVQKRFESGMKSLIKMAQESGASVVLGGLYPNGLYRESHAHLLRETHEKMKTWGVPILDWLDALDNGNGQWKPGLFFDHAHPNSEGHRIMFNAIDMNLFASEIHPQPIRNHSGVFEIFSDNLGFRFSINPTEKYLEVENNSPHIYGICPNWDQLKIALEQNRMESGLYMSDASNSGITQSISISSNGNIESFGDIPPFSRAVYRSSCHYFSPEKSEVLFYDGNFGILKELDNAIRFINETYSEYNINPVWNEVRDILKLIPQGVYVDTTNPAIPFRTMMVGQDGLENRLKIPAKTSFVLKKRSELHELRRTAILPLGHRCAIRMLLSKLDYDGPCYPFDLTRTTDTRAVADLVASDFRDMCNPQELHYVHEVRRIYHSRFQGLSFAHDIEDGDDPIGHAHDLYRKIQKKYQKRADRFLYTIAYCDEILFVRTGYTDAGSVHYLMEKLYEKCGDKPFKLLLISAQSSSEFQGFHNVRHYDYDFNPDTMMDDAEYWSYCAQIFEGILNEFTISSHNLYLCPPHLKTIHPHDVQVPNLPGHEKAKSPSWSSGYESGKP